MRSRRKQNRLPRPRELGMGTQEFRGFDGRNLRAWQRLQLSRRPPGWELIESSPHDTKTRKARHLNPKRTDHGRKLREQPLDFFRQLIKFFVNVAPVRL